MSIGAEKHYSVKQLAKLAGVSVRTLHVYDKMGLLKPSVRTRAGYRQYGITELLRLQQILFYKEMDIPLKEICQILDEPDFDLIAALNGHKASLIQRRTRIDTLLQTIDHTVFNLKNKTMQNSDFEKLYEGMPREQAMAWRNDAIAKWGEENVVRSEHALLHMPPGDLEQLKTDQKDIRTQLRLLRNADPQSAEVQKQIEHHYQNIRGFWGLKPADGFKADRYKGLADLYITDDRYLAENGKPDPEFAQFMRKAIHYFAQSRLQ